MERTLIIFKPDSIKRGLVGEILSRFEKVGLKVVGSKMVRPDEAHFHHHYEAISNLVSRRGQKVFDVTLGMMQESPVIAMVLEGVEAVSLVRKMIGTTEPKSALPGTIRGDYAHMSYGHGIPNILHASGDETEAAAEIKHWFNDSELFDYQTVHESYTQAKARKK